MKGGIGQLMKQAQEMQANMKKAQEEMASITVVGESGAGAVRITMTCQHQVQAVEIDHAMIGDDKEMLEDLIVAAFNVTNNSTTIIFRCVSAQRTIDRSDRAERAPEARQDKRRRG